MQEVYFSDRLKLSFDSQLKEFKPLFEELRKKWRRFDKLSLARSIVHYMAQERAAAHSLAIKQSPKGSKNFVGSVLLIWILNEDRPWNGPLKIATEQDTVSLLNLAWQLNDCKEAVETLKENVFLAMRNLAMQQFDFQENQLKYEFCRSWLLFTSLEPSSLLRQKVENLTKMPLEDALALVFLFSIAFSVSTSDSDTQNLRGLVRSTFATRSHLLNTLLAFDGTHLRKEIAVRDSVEALYAPTPFARYPLVALGKEEFLVVDSHLASRTAEQYAHRLIVDFGSPKEKQIFTNLVETYANRRTKEVFPTRATVGTDVTKEFGKEKHCDQIIQLAEDFVLLVEVKAGSVPSSKRASMSEKFLFSAIQGIVGRGLEQLEATAAQLLRVGKLKQVNHCVGLIVTHENFRLSDGHGLLEMLPSLEAWSTSTRSSDQMSQFEFFVITLSEFDVLLDLHAVKKIDLAEVLIRAVEKSRNEAGHRFSLSGYLTHEESNHMPDHLEKARAAAFRHASEVLIRK